MQLVTLRHSDAKDTSESDYDALRSELRWMKGCIHILSLLVAFLFLSTLGVFSLAIFRFVNVNSSPIQLGQIEIMNNTELINDLVTEESKHVEENVSLILAYLSGIEETILSLRNIVAGLETKFDANDYKLALLRSTLESHLSMSDTDILGAGLSSLKKLVSSLEARLNATEDEITNLISLRSSLTNMETQLNMTNVMVSSLHNNLTSQPSM